MNGGIVHSMQLQEQMRYSKLEKPGMDQTYKHVNVISLMDEKRGV